MTGWRKLAVPRWERHSRGLAAAPGSSRRARSSLLAMCTTWGKPGARDTHLGAEAPPTTPSGCPATPACGRDEAHRWHQEGM